MTLHNDYKLRKGLSDNRWDDFFDIKRSWFNYEKTGKSKWKTIREQLTDEELIEALAEGEKNAPPSGNQFHRAIFKAIDKRINNKTPIDSEF